ncbi:MAG: hypothetical protein KIS77_02160 [Saprospiraceae bacterium]|nr:hypothetical protein [Saprospiraceae bacterium]
MHPSHCGACTNETIEFIKSLGLSEKEVFFIFSSKDDAVIEKLSAMLGSNVAFPDHYFMEKYGMVGPYSILIRIKEGRIVAQENLIPEKYTVVTELIEKSD